MTESRMQIPRADCAFFSVKDCDSTRQCSPVESPQNCGCGKPAFKGVFGRHHGEPSIKVHHHDQHLASI